MPQVRSIGSAESGDKFCLLRKEGYGDLMEEEVPRGRGGGNGQRYICRRQPEMKIGKKRGPVS